MPERQVTIAKREQAPDRDPLILDVNGEKYRCNADISDFAIMDLAAASSKQDAGDIIDTSSAFMAFLEEVFEPGELSRFKHQARSSRWSVDDLLPIVQEVVEHYAGRPTGPRSPLPTGETPTTTPSKVVSLSEGTVVAAETSEADLLELIRG
jgi:hypothetical protein